MHMRTRRGGGGAGASAPLEFLQKAIFGGGGGNHVIFGQNHLIFEQAMKKIVGQQTPAPLNETGPVRYHHLINSLVHRLFHHCRLWGGGGGEYSISGHSYIFTLLKHLIMLLRCTFFSGIHFTPYHRHWYW